MSKEKIQEEVVDLQTASVDDIDATIEELLEVKKQKLIEQEENYLKSSIEPLKDVKVYPLKSKVLIMEGTYASITNITLAPECIMYTLEYFIEGTIQSMRMYDFQLEELMVLAKKDQVVGFKEKDEK